MWDKFKKRKWVGLQVFLVIVLVLSLILSGGVHLRDRTDDAQTIGMGQKTFTIGMVDVAYAAGTPDYACDGVDDNVQFQLAFDALPATGGKIVALGGNYSFSAAVTRAIDNITVEGMGFATFISRDGANPIFTIGVQSNYTFINLRLDAGGVNDTGASEVTYENVDIGGTHWAYDTSSDIGGASWDIPSGRGATLIVAASDAGVEIAAQADYLCDGAADEVQINAAIAALPATGGSIELSDGTFDLAATVDINKDNVLIWGQGKSTVIEQSFNGDHLITIAAGTDYFTLRDLSLDGDATTFGNTGFNIIYGSATNADNITYVLLEGLRIDDSQGAGIYLDGVTDSDIHHVRYDRVAITNSQRASFVLGSTEYAWITDCYASGSGAGWSNLDFNSVHYVTVNNFVSVGASGAGMSLDGGEYVQYIGSKVFNAGASGLAMVPAGGNFAFLRHIQIEGIIVYNSTTEGIEIHVNGGNTPDDVELNGFEVVDFGGAEEGVIFDGVANARLSNGYVTGGGVGIKLNDCDYPILENIVTDGNTGYNVTFDTVTHATVSSVKAINGGSSGFYIIDSSDHNVFNGVESSDNTDYGLRMLNSNYNKIHDSIFWNNDSAGTDADGIRLVDSDYNEIINNQSGRATSTQRFGVLIDNAACDGNIVKDNDLRGNATLGLSDFGTDTRLNTYVVPFSSGTDPQDSGYEIDVGGEMARAWAKLPTEVLRVSRIKIYARSVVLEADAMRLEINVNGGADNEAFNTHSTAAPDTPSASTNFAANDIIYWTLNTAQIIALAGGDSVEVKVLHEVAGGADCATDAFFRTIEFEYY